MSRLVWNAYPLLGDTFAGSVVDLACVEARVDADPSRLLKIEDLLKARQIYRENPVVVSRMEIGPFAILGKLREVARRDRHVVEGQVDRVATRRSWKDDLEATGTEVDVDAILWVQPLPDVRIDGQKQKGHHRDRRDERRRKRQPWKDAVMRLSLRSNAREHAPADHRHDTTRDASAEEVPREPVKLTPDELKGNRDRRDDEKKSDRADRCACPGSSGLDPRSVCIRLRARRCRQKSSSSLTFFIDQRPFA